MRVAAVTASTFPSISPRFSRILIVALVVMCASVSVFAQNVTIAPTTLTFANQAVGSTSAAKVVTVTNHGGSQPVVITASSGFSETDTCNGNIASGGSCKVSVYFSPTTVAKITGTLSINDSTDNYLLASVSLTGTGVAPTTLSPATLTFTKQALDTTSAAKTVTLKNLLPTPLTISSIVFSGGPAPSDYAWSGTCLLSPNTLAAGQSCTINVTFAPSIAGSIPATMTVTHSASTSPQTVSITGTGVAPTTLSVSSMAFGTAYEGNSTAAKTVTLTNNQSTALSFSSIATTANFGITTNTCGSSIAAGAKCAVGVVFSPVQTGAITGSLTFTDTASTSPQTVSLNGTGSAPVAITPTSHAFPATGVGKASAASSISLTNHLTTALPISSISTTGDFAVSTNTCGSSVAAGQKCTVGVTFNPTALGSRTGTLNINYSSYGSPAVVTLSGTGSMTGVTAIAVSPANPSISNGGTQQFAATGTFTGGVMADATNYVTWSSSVHSVATIGTTGLASAVAPGTTVIKAASGAINGTTSLVVSSGPTYTIGGTVSGLSGAGLVLQDNGGNNLSISANGGFTFTTPIAGGSSYSVSVLTQPSNPAQTCLVSNGSGTANANVTNVQVACTTNTYTIGGSISGYTGSGLVLQDNGGDNLTVTSGATSFTFATKIASGAGYGVTVLTQPSSPAQTCSVTSGSGTVGSANVTNVQIACTAVTYTIGGTISGYAGSGLVLQDNGGNNLTVSSGATGFTFSQGIASGSGYNVTVLTQPSTPAQTCLVTNGSGTVGSANVTNVQIACTTNTYTIGGSISGYTGSGLVLQDNGGDNLAVTSGANSFTFATKIASGAGYGVTVLTQPSSPAQTCSVTSGSGTVGSANVTSVQITCSAVTYTIGGTISGYSGSGLVLQDNGGNNLSVTSGATNFTFSQPIASGGGYNVTVLTQPSSPAQTCLVTNGSGTATANVTNVQIACTNVTYTIGGTISGYSGSGLVLQDNGGNNLTVTSGATTFTFSAPVNSGSAYSVTVLTQPSSPTETCLVTNGSGTATGNVTNVQIACSTQSYTIGGTISGYSGSGMVLQDNGGNNLSVTSGATNFTFSQAIPSGTTYAVTVLTQPSSPAQTCLVTNGSGTATANVTSVSIACTTTTYTIGGSISGYSGSGLVLQDNGGNNLSVNSGATSFTFSQAINAGSTYSVTVLTQPSSPTENCTVTNGSGTANANVSNVQVTCSAITVSATLTPSSAHQGQSQAVVITGTGTSFGPTTTINFGANITTGTLAVNGPTSASVPITIGNAAATGLRNVTITTGAQQVTASFSILAGTPAVTVINPNTIQPTQSENVTITGAFTNWVNGTTKASFGPGVAVGGAAPGAFGPVTVNSATSLTASLVTSGATTGSSAVQVQTSSQTLTVNNGISIQTCNTTTPAVLSISPNNAAITVPLNAPVQVQFNEPMSSTSFSLGNGVNNTVYFYDTVSNLEVPGAISLDASGSIATITPSEALPAGRSFVVSLSSASSIQDTCGNTLSPQQYTFTTAFSNDLTGPALSGSSPVSGDTGIPVNSPIVLQFNDQLDPITAMTGFSLMQGSNAVAGTFTYSTDDKTVTFAPQTFLIPNSTYTVGYSAQITDTAGNALTNPGSFTFVTGATILTTSPFVTAVNPPSLTLGVGLNVKPRVSFSTAVNGLTVPAALSLSYANGGPTVPATVTVATNRLSATITPSSALLANTQYAVNVCGYMDIAGNIGNCSTSTFVTGTTSLTGHVTVSTISPPNAQTLVPANVQIVAVMSNTIDPTTLTSSSITLTPANGSAVAGTISLASDGVTLTFIPNASLASTKVYTVAISGFSDAEGNTVTSFTSTFTSGSNSYGASSFKLSSTTPATKATGVSVTSPVTFTMSNLVNAGSVNASTAAVEICFDGSACSTSESVAGTYSVSGATITFTPLTAYPASTVMGMEVNGLIDEAGDIAPDGFKYFTTASTVDSTAPTVTISPSNGTTNVGLNTQIVLTFSKSINTATISSTSLAVFGGDAALNYNYTISADNRTIVLTPASSAWTSGAVITVALSNAIQDLSGNSLANTSSQFTLTTAASGTVPTVVSMRPGNGSTNVPANTAITLFTSAAMNASTIVGAFNVTDNGVVVSGSVQLFSNGQAIEFTPSSSFNAGDVIQVFLGSTAQGANGATLSSFSGQFTVTGALSTAAQAVAMNPFPNATSVPQNTVIQVEYNQPLLAGSVSCNGSSGSVTLMSGSSNYLSPNCTVSGQVITISPTSNLASNTAYTVVVTNAVTNTSGTPVQASTFNFTAGTSVDNAAPTIVSQAPSNNATNVGTNARVTFNFNKAINPISVSASTIQLTGGSVTEVPSSISFSSDYTRVRIIPQAPLPPSTAMTLTVNGVTSQAGVSVATSTANFTTAAGPDFTTPYVAYSSVAAGQTNVPVNAVFSMQFSKPMDIGSLDPAKVYVKGGVVPTAIASTTASWSSDQTTVFLVPTSPLSVGDSYSLCSSSLTDIDGNVQASFCAAFTAAFTTSSSAPSVVDTNPESAQTQVPINTPVQVLFNEPIQQTTIGQITLKTGGNAVAVSTSFTDANQLLTLLPAVPLLPNTSYTISISGVKDTANNQMTGTVTSTFTTAGSFDLVMPSVLLTDPAPDTVGIGTNVIARVQFSERVNPLSVVTSSNETYNQGSVELLNGDTGAPVPITVTMSSDRTTAILTPTSALSPSTLYQISVGNAANYYDVAGNIGATYSSFFTTGASSVAANVTVSSISPANNATAVATNTLVTVAMTGAIDPTSVTNSSIAVKTTLGVSVSGTVSLASDNVTLTFSPAGSLAASTAFTVAVSGLRDAQGNAITTSTSGFTTGTANLGVNSFVVSQTNPADQTQTVPVTSTVAFTMSNLIDAASANSQTVQVVCSNSPGLPCANAVMTGTYSVNGKTVTFTPTSPYPGSASMSMVVNGLMDIAGNIANGGYYVAGSFATAATNDTTKPTVSITPSNGATNIGLNPQIVLTFSESINPTTIGINTIGLFSGDTALSPTMTISADSRTVVLSGVTLPPSTTITVEATHQIADLSGNLLNETTSQFTTTSAVLSSSPNVVNERPASGATNVPANTVITLFTSAPMNASTIAGALYISQNGVPVSGTPTVAANGQSIVFTPSSAFAAGSTIQVFLNSTALDIYGNSLTTWEGTFTVAGSTSTSAVVQALNPFANATNVPLNTTIQIGFNQAIQSGSVSCTGNSGSITLMDSSNNYLSPSCSVSGQVITINPTGNLSAGTQYTVTVTNSVTNTNSVPVTALTYTFATGATSDAAAPTVVSVAPPNSATSIGTNAGVSVNFNKAINPVSVTGSTIQLSGGSVTEVPSSISFTPDYKRVTIVPQSPLPPSTLMTIAISGVTSEAGVSVSSQNTTFTTMAGPDLTAPYVLNTSVAKNQTVGTNAAFAMQFNEPLDPGSVNPAGAQDVYIYDTTASSAVSANITFSTDLTTVMLTPVSNLTAGDQFSLCSSAMTNLSGIPQVPLCVNFYAGSGPITTGPSILQVSPPSGATAIGTNALVQILFNEQIDGASLAGVTLKHGSSVVPTTASLFDGNQGIQLLPTTLLSPNTTYTINVTGVLDITGNAQTSFPSQSFTTGGGVDLVAPTIVSTNPTSPSQNVPDNTTIQVVFSEAMDPASFDPTTSFTLQDPNRNPVPATISFSTDYKTVTLTPNSSLIGGGTAYFMLISQFGHLYDLSGNSCSPMSIFFTTQ